MKVRCWNCGTEDADLEKAECGFCGELLRPDEGQREQAVHRIDYLIRELKRWKSVPEWWKREAEENYQKRVVTLRDFPSEGLLVEPAQPRPRPVPGRRSEERKPEVQPPATTEQPVEQPALADQPEILAEVALSQAENPWIVEAAPVASSEADLAMQMLMGAFSEKKIRLLYALGGVLLLASGVGILRSSWEGWGRQAMALLLTFLPALFFWLAAQLRERLPVSSRMFTVLGGGMLPIGVLFLNTFNVAGLHAPALIWNPIAFLLGWVVNHRLARLGHEPVCAYLAGLCWALAGWASGSGLVLGLISFGGAMALFWKERDSVHFTRVAHGLSMLGLLAAFTQGPLEMASAATLFLLAVVYFTTSAWLLNTPGAMVVSSIICLLCAGWLSSLLQWPHSSVGLAALLQAALYLRRGPLGQQLAIYLTAGVLLLFLGLPLLVQIPTNFADVSPHQLLTCAVTGALGAAFYGLAAYRYRRPAWVYGATLCSLYAYFTLLALLMRSQPSLYRPWLVALALLWQVAVMVLRRRIPESYLRPWVWTAAGMSLLLVPLNIVMQMAGADFYTPWIYLGVAGVTCLSALFEHDPRGLYVSLVTAALAYASWLPVIFGPSQEPNLGLGFTAFVAALALLGLGLRRNPSTQSYATPVLVVAAVAGWGFSALQIVYLQMGYWHSAPTALIFYGVAFALVRQRYANLHAGLCLLTALSCYDHMGVVGVAAALAACAVLMGLALPGYMEAAFLWTALAAVLGPASLKIVPALLWLAAAARPSHLSLKDRQSLAHASSLLLLPALPGCWKSWSNAGLALACGAQLALGVRWNLGGLLTLAWLQLKAVYLCAFGFDDPLAWTVALWAEWVGFYLINRVIASPLVGLEALTTFTLLLLSWFHRGWMAILNPWLVVLVMLVRSRQTQRADLDTLCHSAVVWACFSTAAVTHTPLFFPLLMFGWSYLDVALDKPRQMQAISLVGWFGCFGVGYPSVVLLLGAGAWALQARRDVNALWGVFAYLYHAYFSLLVQAHVSSVELYIVPVAVWFLAWGTRFTDNAGFRQLGLVTLLAPSLLLSLFSVEHALWAGSLGMGLLVIGQLIHRGPYQAWGGLAILTEVTVQAVLLARNLPWHLWAVAGGILLVGMGFLVERKRQEVTAASRNFLHQLGSW
ncbi:hypothetical protein IV102_26415 [bacterium]|nr:hypothetical protein [bacterium]